MHADPSTRGPAAWQVGGSVAVANADDYSVAVANGDAYAALSIST